MTDYSKMSDYEINVKVGASIGLASKWVAEYKGTDYCNDPSDAWPIIVENKISVMFDRSVEHGDSSEWCLASSPCDRYIVDYVSSDKLLRAAMIVYLMMKASEHEN
ncbi:phage protein NinX family protein [Hafnia paralvei]|uniref:phage protein NinX family protein n=1 Tax=Hafnia paralvei TaxID=546367 RepID=UPI0027B895C6|nr:phage protein NinX family protein [Hafnia paralvei]